MTNGEKYKDTIIKYIKGDSDDNTNNAYCDFIKSKILPYYGLNCKGLECHDCNTIESLWFNEEYKEPEEKVDWTKVAVDTPVLVRNVDGANWRKRHFAKYQNSQIFTYTEGKTSWSAQNTVSWKQGKLANEAK